MRWAAIIVLSLCAACAEEQRSEPAPQAPRAAPKTIEMEVAWPQVTSIDRGALGHLSEASRSAVARSRIPVLVMEDPAFLGPAVVIAKPAFTALSTRHDGVTISLHAHRLAHRHPEVPPAEGNRLVRGHKGFVTQNEAIWSATWIENGISYDLDVECASLPDPRCDSEQYLLSIADSLRYVGGQAHAAEVLR